MSSRRGRTQRNVSIVMMVVGGVLVSRAAKMEMASGKMGGEAVAMAPREWEWQEQ